MGPNMGQQLNKQVRVDLQANHKQMKPKQANHQLKLNLQTIMQVNKQENLQLKTTPDMRKVKSNLGFSMHNKLLLMIIPI